MPRAALGRPPAGHSHTELSIHLGREHGARTPQTLDQRQTLLTPANESKQEGDTGMKCPRFTADVPDICHFRGTELTQLT